MCTPERGTPEYEEARQRYREDMERDGYSAEQVGYAIVYTRPAIVVDDMAGTLPELELTDPGADER